MNIESVVAESKQIIANWGFPPPNAALVEGLSPKVAEIVYKYYKDFPNVEQHLYFTGNAHKAVKVASTALSLSVVITPLFALTTNNAELAFGAWLNLKKKVPSVLSIPVSHVPLLSIVARAEKS